jgi:hypothetical protein
MKKIALLTLTIGIVLLLFGVWLLQSNKGANEAAARRLECTVIYGEEPANIREKETCLTEADEIKSSYDQRMYTSIGVGLVVAAISAYVLTKKRQQKAS